MLPFPSGGYVRVSKAKVSLLHLWVVIVTLSLQELAGCWPGCTEVCPGHRDLSCASVIQVLLLPGGRGDGTVGVHDDFGTADDHDYEEEAEENKASQG